MYVCIPKHVCTNINASTLRSVVEIIPCKANISHVELYEVEIAHLILT